MSQIGEGGVNLSGGQKARVGLARALYADADLYLLDDPFSAVDPAVGSAMFKRAVMHCLSRRGKTVVLATHKVDLLANVDKVIAFYSEDETQDTTIDILRAVHNSEIPVLSPQGSPIFTSTEMVSSDIAPLAERIRTISLDSAEDCTLPREIPDKAPKALEDKKASTKLVAAEERSVGSVSMSTYANYLAAGGTLSCSIVGLLFVGGNALGLIADIELKAWAEADAAGGANSNSLVTIYSALTAAVVVAGLVRSVLFFSVSLRASTRLHDDAYRAVVKSPLSFFSANPVGRVLNKFSSDLGQVDELLPPTLFDTIQNALLCLGKVVFTIIALTWIVLMVLPLILIMIRVRGKFSKVRASLRESNLCQKVPYLLHLALHSTASRR